MKEAGSDLLAALKRSAGGGGPALVITPGSPPAVLLRPIATQAGRIDPEDVRCLTDWRNRFVTAFLTEFQADEARTERWLLDVVGPNPGKILFMLEDTAGSRFGYMGLDMIDWMRSYGEADAIVRGADAPKGTMTLALRTLLGWARSALGLQVLGVRVRSDNRALAFYEKCGFLERKRVPLRRVDEPCMVRWVEDPRADGNLSLVYLEYHDPRSADHGPGHHRPAERASDCR